MRRKENRIEEDPEIELAMRVWSRKVLIFLMFFISFLQLFIFVALLVGVGFPFSIENGLNKKLFVVFLLCQPFFIMLGIIDCVIMYHIFKIEAFICSSRKTLKDEKEMEMSIEHLKWNKMWNLWASGKIDSPFKELMEYYNGVNNGGHHCHFDNVYGNSNLEEYVKQLEKILPEPLKNNLLIAYKTYMSNPDDIGEKNSEILSRCDKVFYENEEKITKILEKMAKKTQN